MSVKSVIEQAFRDWLKDALSLTDEDVIIGEDDDGNRPPKPYATVTVLMTDRRVSVDDEQQRNLDGSGDPQVRIKGQREATVSLQSFGEVSADWFPDALLALPLPAAQAIFDAANLTVLPLNGSTFSPSAIDTLNEPRFLKEFEVAYARESGFQSLPEATDINASITYERYDGDAEAFTDTFTVTST